MGRACGERGEAKARRGEGLWGEIPVQAKRSGHLCAGPARGGFKRSGHLSVDTTRERLRLGAGQLQEVPRGLQEVWAPVRARFSPGVVRFYEVGFQRSGQLSEGGVGAERPKRSGHVSVRRFGSLR